MQKLIIQPLLYFCASILFWSNAHANTLPCLDIKNHDQMAKYQGSYLATDLQQDIKKTRDIFQSQKKWRTKNIFAQAIMVSAENQKASIALTNWHEGTTLEESPQYCVTPASPEKLALYEHGKLQALYQKLPDQVNIYLFNLLFNSCYHDEHNKKVCLKNKTISMNGNILKADLILDESELNAEGNYVKVEGDSLFWVFIPVVHGWNVYKSDWASKEDFQPADLSKPWKILRD